MPLTWITHKGKRILLNDFSNQKDEQRLIDQLEEELRLLESEPGKVLMLVDVTSSPVSRNFLAKAKEYAPRIEKCLTRQAIVGVDGMKTLLLSGFNLVSRGIPLKPFQTVDAAKDYLVD